MAVKAATLKCQGTCYLAFTFPKELGIDKSNYIRIPMSLVEDDDLDKNRTAIFSYIS